MLEHTIDVFETICLADDELDLVVGSLNPGIAQSVPNRIVYDYKEKYSA